jgi:DNA topoisomerase-1
VSLKPPDDPYTVTLERALEVIRLKKEADANRIIQDFGVDNIQVLNGRYGPYITDGKRNARMPKDTDPKAITLEVCRELLANAPLRGQRFGRKKPGATKDGATKDGATKDGATKDGAAKDAAAVPATAAKAAKEAKPAKKAAAKAAPPPKAEKAAAPKKKPPAKKSAAKRKKS